MNAEHLASASRYNRFARLLHWTIALLVIANLLLGLVHDALQDIVRLMPLHKSVGLTVLALSLVRLVWRLCWRAPPYPPSLGRLNKVAARSVHALFYGLIVAIPLSGWVISSASDRPLSWFGLLKIPKFAINKQSPAYGIGHETHELLGWLMLALVIAHVAAALRHHFLLHDGMLRRML